MACQTRVGCGPGTSCAMPTVTAAGRGRADGDARPARTRGTDRAARRVAEIDILTMGITFTVYSDGAEHRPGLAVRRHPAGHRRRRVGRRSSAASSSGCVALNRFIDDLYNDQQVIADGVFPAELLAGLGELPARVPRRAPQVRRVGPHLRLRPRARRRRRDVRARGQPARAVGRQLRAREPGRRQAGVRRGVRSSRTSVPSTPTPTSSTSC